VLVHTIKGDVPLSRRGLRASGRATVGSLDPRHNSLNLVRLALACTVLVAHSFTLSGNGIGPTFNEQHLGTWAVYSFFCLSGYLITGSRLRTPFSAYLSHRIARIYPGFLVSLVVVAFGFAPVAYLREHGTLDGFLTLAPTPLHYVFANLWLNMVEYGVAGTISTNPYPGAWDGSLWSLYYEFLCYLAVGGLLALGLVRRVPVLLVPVFAFTVWCSAHPATVLAYFGGNGQIGLLLTLLPFFFGGAALFAVRDLVPLTWWVALPGIALFVALVAWQGVWGPWAGAPLLTLFLLWLGKVLPCPGWFRHHDISYGCYIYAFPSQQLVAAFGGGAHGTFVMVVLAAPLMFALAVLSWFVVERPAMRAVRGRRPARNEGDVAGTPTGTAPSPETTPAADPAPGVPTEVVGRA
jgi:peptidoglycan/LPS O-acetylase OafA/YrhL